MGMLKRLFSKRDKKPSPDSNLPENLDAYILIGSYGGENFVTINFEDNKELEMAAMLFLLCSEDVVEECNRILRKNYSDEQAEAIVGATHSMLQAHGSIPTDEDTEEPVVDPCNVFSAKDQNEYRG